MKNLPRVHFLLIFLLLILVLTGCELRRTGDAGADLQPVSELPPTLAPLGADSAEVMGEATAIPTVINVQPTATQSLLAAGEAAPSPAEPVVPTAEAINLVQPAPAGSAQAEAAAVAPETFTPPQADQPIIVDAPAGNLPDSGPIAANPPAGQSGDAGMAGVGGATYMVNPGDTLFGISMAYGVSVQAIMAANGLASETIYAGQQLTMPTDGGPNTYAPPDYNNMPAPTGNGFTHTVVPGDTLFRIAMQYGVAVDAIAGANGIPYPFLIQIGQELVVPAQGTYGSPPPSMPNTYPPDTGYYPQGPNGQGYYPQQPPANGYYPQGPNGQGYYPQQPPANGYYPQGPNGQGYYPQQPPANGYYPQDPNGQQGYYPQQPPTYPAPGYNNQAPGGAGTHVVGPGETLFSIAQRYGLTAEMIAGANGLANPNQIYVGQVLYLP
jgi:LysM repeat protein